MVWSQLIVYGNENTFRVNTSQLIVYGNENAFRVNRLQLIVYGTENAFRVNRIVGNCVYDMYLANVCKILLTY